ncbi:hypothetical protein Tco_1435648 [Tanacetum coccineum]
MVEEIYEEESVDSAIDSNSSSELAPKKTLLDQVQDTSHSTPPSSQANDKEMACSSVSDHNVLENPIINDEVSLTLRCRQDKDTGALRNNVFCSPISDIQTTVYNDMKGSLRNHGLDPWAEGRVMFILKE